MLPRMRWFGSSKTLLAEASTDEHLILSIDLINGLRRGRNKNFEATAEARHNRSHLSRRLDHSRLYKLSRRSHLLVRTVDRLANECYLVARLTSALANKFLQLAYFALDNRQRVREVHCGGGKMGRHHVELLRDLLSLHCNLSALLAHYRYSLDERL